MAFSEKLRETVTKSHKIGSGLMKDFIMNPIGGMLRWDTVKNKIPSLVPPGDSTMRNRIDNYLGYQRHRVKFDDDFWKRRQDYKVSPLESQWKDYKRIKSDGVDAVLEKSRSNGEGVLSV